MKIGERIIPSDITSLKEYVNFLLHIFSYKHVLSLIPHNSKILDLGCGEGYGTLLLSHHARSVVGIDVDESIINHARQKYRGKVEILAYDGKKIPFEDETFDAVVSSQVIEHVEDVVQFLFEAKRVLKIGGALFVSTPNRVYRLKPGQKPWNIYHKREYDSEVFKRILLNVFERVQVQGVRGCDEIQRIEKDRVKKNRFLASLDFLSLRTRLPDKWKIKMAGIISNFLHASEDISDNFKQKYSINDIWIINDDLDEGLHLFATCIKEK